MNINNQLIGVPLPVVVNRDRWQETEGNSGSAFNDVIAGDDAVPSAIGGAGFTGCDALDAAGLARIPGLARIVPSLSRLGGDVVTAASVSALSQTDGCPLKGNVWGGGNILLGGAGSDTLTGNGGNDILDGDRSLNVAITVRNAAGAEIGRTDLMEHQATSGTFGAGTAGMTLQAAVFAGLVDAGNLVSVRAITSPAAGTDNGSVDTAVFTGLRADYIIGNGADGAVTVDSQGGLEGVDTLRNIEQLRFLGEPLATQLVTVRTVATPNIGTATLLSNVTAAGVTTGRASVSFTAGTATGTNLAATSFQVVALDAAGGVVATSATGASSPLTVTGLPLGGTYTFVVIGLATTPASPTAPATTWASAASAESNALTPSAAPAAPTGLTAARGNALATLAWTPGSNNGQALTAYQVEITRAGVVQPVVALTVTGPVATANSATVTGLTNNITYRFRIRAVNATGPGAFSNLSNTVTPVGAVAPPPPPGPVVAGAPSAPAIGRAIQGQSNGIISAFANWAAPASSGTSPITSYEVSALQMGPDGVTVVATTVFTTTSVTPPLTFEATGLVAGANYRFTVVAINTAGRSPASARSNAALAR
jgi:hypothetical protein